MTATSLYVTAGGSYAGTTMDEERWQVGVRLLVTNASEIDLVGALPTTFEPAAANLTVSDPAYSGHSNWLLEMGLHDLDPLSYLVDQALPAFTTWLDQDAISSRVEMDQLVLFPIGPNGVVKPAPPYAQGSGAYLDLLGTLPNGGGASNMLPPQVSIVASHRTPQTGRSGRGRMYIPGPGNGGSNIQADGRLTDGQNATVAAAQEALLQGLSGVFSDVWIFPAIIGGNFTQYALINAVKVGNIFDTQRRRRNQLTESYAQETWDPLDV